MLNAKQTRREVNRVCQENTRRLSEAITNLMAGKITAKECNAITREAERSRKDLIRRMRVKV